jgi:hypothetical protein
MFQQLVGINVVFYYGAVLWQAVGFSESDALLINVLSGALSIGACLLTVLLIDRIGRKPLLWVGSVGMSVALVLMVVAFASGAWPRAPAAVRWHGAAGAGRRQCLRGVLQHVLGPGDVGDAGRDVPEPDPRPGTGGCRCGAMDLELRDHRDLPDAAGRHRPGRAYGIYTVAAILSIFFVVRYVRETKGKELEQMEG